MIQDGNSQFRSMDCQTGLTPQRSATRGRYFPPAVYRMADKPARPRWGNVRFYPYPNPPQIKSPNPGNRFKPAAWQIPGHTRRGLAIPEKPNEQHTFDLMVNVGNKNYRLFNLSKRLQRTFRDRDKTLRGLKRTESAHPKPQAQHRRSKIGRMQPKCNRMGRRDPG